MIRFLKWIRSFFQRPNNLDFGSTGRGETRANISFNHSVNDGAVFIDPRGRIEDFDPESFADCMQSKGD